MRRVIAGSLAALLLAVGLAACGGSGKKPITHAAFVAAANSICLDSRVPSGVGSSTEDVEHGTKTLNAAEIVIQELQKLHQDYALPASVEPAFGHYLAEEEKAIVFARAVIHDDKTNASPSIGNTAIERMHHANSGAGKDTSQLGLYECEKFTAGGEFDGETYHAWTAEIKSQRVEEAEEKARAKTEEEKEARAKAPEKESEAAREKEEAAEEREAKGTFQKDEEEDATAAEARGKTDIEEAAKDWAIAKKLIQEAAPKEIKERKEEIAKYKKEVAEAKNGGKEAVEPAGYEKIGGEIKIEEEELAKATRTVRHGHAYDSSAKTLAQTAQTAADEYMVEHGSYAGMTVAKLHKIDPAIPSEGSTTANGPILKSVTAGAGSYSLTVEAQVTKDEFTIASENGEIKRLCVVKGSQNVTGCDLNPGSATEGTWE